jgi:hypothetical protein
MPRSTGRWIRRTAWPELGGWTRPKWGDSLGDWMASETIFHDLTLLLHSIRLKRPTGYWPVAVWAGADAKGPVQQVSQLGEGPPAEVGQRSPLLILPAVGDLVRKDGQILLVPFR